jgi:hypothetical protein
MAGARERTAVLLIRLWREEGNGPGSPRARIIQTLDVSGPVRTKTAAASEEEILAVVRAWLSAFAARR